MALALRAATAGTQIAQADAARISPKPMRSVAVGPLADHQHGREHADDRDAERVERSGRRRQAPHDRKPQGVSDTDADNTGKRGRQ